MGLLATPQEDLAFAAKATISAWTERPFIAMPSFCVTSGDAVDADMASAHPSTSKKATILGSYLKDSRKRAASSSWRFASASRCGRSASHAAFWTSASRSSSSVYSLRYHSPWALVVSTYRRFGSRISPGTRTNCPSDNLYTGNFSCSLVGARRSESPS